MILEGQDEKIILALHGTGALLLETIVCFPGDSPQKPKEINWGQEKQFCFLFAAAAVFFLFSPTIVQLMFSSASSWSLAEIDIYKRHMEQDTTS